MMEMLGKALLPNFIDDMLRNVLQLIRHPPRTVCWGCNSWLDVDVAWLQDGFLYMWWFLSRTLFRFIVGLAMMTLHILGIFSNESITRVKNISLLN